MTIADLFRIPFRRTLVWFLSLSSPPPTARQQLQSKIEEAHDYRLQFLIASEEAAAKAAFNADIARRMSALLENQSDMETRYEAQSTSTDRP